jgi:hypothetical protein
MMAEIADGPGSGLLGKQFLADLSKVLLMCEALDGLVKGWTKDSVPKLVMPTSEYQVFLKAVRNLVPYGLDTSVFFDVETDYKRLKTGRMGQFRGIYPVFVSKDAIAVGLYEG